MEIAFGPNNGLDPNSVGQTLRALKGGLTRACMDIAQESKATHEERGRVIEAVSMVSDAIQDVFDKHSRRGAPAKTPPPLTSR